MKKSVKLSGFVLLLILLIGISQFAYPKTMITHAFDIELEPISPLVTEAPITMKLAFTPHIKYPWCKDVKITVKTLDYVNKFSEENWDAELDENQHYSTTFQVSIPDNDTCAIHVTLECQRLRETFKLFFVTTGDSVVREGGNPRGHFGVPPPPSSNTDDPIKDTLTEEQLLTEYEVILNLHDPKHLNAAESILGPIPDSSLYDSRRGYYKLNVSLENLIKLAEQPVGFEFTSPPPWDRRKQNPNASITRPKSQYSKDDEIDADTLTEDQLRREHEVILFLRDSTQRKLVEQIIDSELDSLKQIGPIKFYLEKMSLEKFIEIKKQNIDAHLLYKGSANTSAAK